MRQANSVCMSSCGIYPDSESLLRISLSEFIYLLDDFSFRIIFKTFTSVCLARHLQTIPTLIVSASLCMHTSMVSLFNVEMGSQDGYFPASLVILPTILKSECFVSISVSDLNYIITQSPACMYQISW
jgi:hypothetical protein